MTVLVPNVGVTDCRRAESLLKHCKQNIVGSFWLMFGYGFKTENIPDWWFSIDLEENSAQAIIDAFNDGLIKADHRDPLYLGFCIIVVADKSNPASLSYVIQHLRMWEEGLGLLELMAKHNIPAYTSGTYFEDFLQTRYSEKKEIYEHLRSTLNNWTINVWEDYCSVLLAEHGQRMLEVYWAR